MLQRTMAQSTRKWCQCQPSRTQQICFSKEAKQLPYSLTFILWNLPNHTLRVYSELKDFWTANEHITSVLRAFLIHSLPHTQNKCSTMQFLTRGLDSEWTSSLEHTRVLCFVLVFFFALLPAAFKNSNMHLHTAWSLYKISEGSS